MQYGNKTGHTIISSGKSSISLEAKKTKTLQLNLPKNWADADALSFTATDFYGSEL